MNFGRIVSAITRRVRLVRWRLGARRCVCGEHVIAPRTTLELRGVLHRTDGPCYHCDDYGRHVADELTREAEALGLYADPGEVE